MDQEQNVNPTEGVKVEPVWSVYLIRTASNHLYCGVTTDVERRFKEHQGTMKGAKYLRGKGPLTIAWSSEVGSKRVAMQLEYRIKRLSKKQKEQIVIGELPVFTLLEC
ncbi:GIY-YIG nuclease family protein [Photobacterium minamisatsumaniensis]|uniref:GIY-YIG nuclease family protein n=1 Tax=Photobacterium minamisatsumaniensis TaxID=2910233 RepID=UPI003D0AC75D